MMYVLVAVVAVVAFVVGAIAGFFLAYFTLLDIKMQMDDARVYGRRGP